MTRAAAVAALLQVARADLGVEERPRGSNAGPRVNQYLAACGLRPGFAWCAAAGSVWLREALGKANPFPMSADCDVFLDFGRRRGIVRTSPAPGFVALRLAAGNRDDANHFGIVTSVDAGAGRFVMLAGNTNDDGAREGYEVAEKSFALSSRYVFLDWPSLFDEAPATVVAVGSKTLPATLADGVTLVPVRAFCRALFADADSRLAFDGGEATFDGVAVPGSEVDASGSLVAPVRDLARRFGLAVRFVASTGRVEVYRASPEARA